MRQLRDAIVRKRPRRLSEQAEDAPVKDFRELAAARSVSAQEDPEEDFGMDFDALSSSIGDDASAAPDPDLDVSAKRPEMPAAPSEAETPHKPAKPRRAQIWDIDADDEEDIPPKSPQKSAKQRAAEAEQVLRQMEEQELEQSKEAVEKLRQQATEQSRAKTRILGFHSGDVEPDALAGPAAPPAGRGEFPAGWLVVVDGPGRGASFTVGAGVSAIGRDQDQTICLSFGDASVSRQNHASIAYDEEQNRFFIGHGGKANLVRRNGTPVLTTEELLDSDHIRVGKTTLRFVALCGPDFTWGSDEEGHDADAANG